MKRHPGGFSLVELMVAMTVTLIVSGAIYGLLTSGSNAFRREPEVADRQQNIRLAMDLLTRDVFNAGTALPPFGQVFTIQDAAGSCAAGLNGCGDPGSLGAAAAAARADGAGDPSTNSDVLEIVAADETCPLQTVCSTAPVAGSAGLFVSREAVPTCLPLPGFVVLTDNTAFTLQPAVATTGGPTDCPGATISANGNLQLGNFVPGWPPVPAIQPPTTSPVFLYGGRLVRYRIAPSGDPLDTSPALWRSDTGKFAADGAPKAEPGEGGFPGTSSPWQLVARGIEDLQVEYLDGSGAGWMNAPRTVLTSDWTTLVRRVRITISARATAANLQGQTSAGGTGPDAIRGQLVTEVSPRAALNELQMGNQFN